MGIFTPFWNYKVIIMGGISRYFRYARVSIKKVIQSGALEAFEETADEHLERLADHLDSPFGVYI